MIPAGKSKQLNEDLMMEHSKHVLEEHGSTSPGSPKPHSREITSQRFLSLPFLCNMPFVPIFALDNMTLYWVWNRRDGDDTHRYFS